MSGPVPNDDGAGSSRPSADLGERIKAARAEQAPGPRSGAADKYNQLTLAWRMTIELVVGTAMGFGIGWGLDSLFGSQPLMMIIFGLLGFAAGIKTVVDTAKEVSRRAERAAQESDEASQRD